MINKVILVGNIGRDPEIRQTQDGREIANLTLATSEHWKDKSTGEKKEKTEWHRIAVFSQGLVNVVKNYVRKGSKLYIEGSLRTRKWTDNHGIDKYVTEVVLNSFGSNLQMLDSKPTGANNAPVAGNVTPELKDVKEAFPDAEVVDDDIPF